MPLASAPSHTPEALQEHEYLSKGAYHWKLDVRDYGWMKHLVNYTNVVSTLQGSLPRHARVLDLGCGDGYCTALLTRSFSNVEGVDSSERAITFARERVHGALFHCMDARALPFPSGSFDGIACIETLEHMPCVSAQAVVAEVHRLLKFRGVFIVTVPSDRFPVSPTHYVHYNSQSLRALLSPFTHHSLEGSCCSPTPLFDQVYRLSSNKYWHFSPLQRFLHEWYAFFYGRCSPSQGVSLLATCRK